MKASVKQRNSSTTSGRNHCEQSPVKKQERAHDKKNCRKQNLDLIPDHNTETAFAERLFIPLEKRGIIKWLLAALDNNNTDQNIPGAGKGGRRPYRANKTLPTPLASKRLNSPHPVSNALLAPLALWHPQPYMAVLTIRVSLIHREPHVRIFECPVSRKAPVT